jgi:hypothetical protein
VSQFQYNRRSSLLVLLVVAFIAGAAVFLWVSPGLSQTTLLDSIKTLDMQGKYELHRLAFFRALIGVGVAQ